MTSAPAAQSVLLIVRDASVGATYQAWLERAGYRVNAVHAYEAARRALEVEAPDVLIAGVRLGAFNGLHLIIRSRIDSPRTAGIVIATADDRALEPEADQAEAVFVVEPVSADALIAAVTQALGGLPV